MQACPQTKAHNERLKERASVGAHETRVQAQSPEFMDESVAAAPRPAGPMPILLSANRNVSNPRLEIKSLAWDHRPRSPGFEMRSYVLLQ